MAFYFSFHSETLFINRLIPAHGGRGTTRSTGRASGKAFSRRKTTASKAPAVPALSLLHRGQQSIYPLGQTGNLAGGILFVDGALHRCFLNNRDRQLQCFLGLISGFQLNGFKDLLHNALHLALVGAIAKPLQLILTIPFLGGFMISQFSTPVHCIFDGFKTLCPTPLHGWQVSRTVTASRQHRRKDAGKFCEDKSIPHPCQATTGPAVSNVLSTPPEESFAENPFSLPNPPSDPLNFFKKIHS